MFELKNHTQRNEKLEQNQLASTKLEGFAGAWRTILGEIE
jgi:hypothetical protein